MKVILTNSDLVFRKAKDFVDFTLAWYSINANNGNIQSTTYDNPYCRAAPTSRLSVSNDGVHVMNNIGNDANCTVYLWDVNGDYIGCGALDNTVFKNGVEISNFLEAPSSYSNAGGAIDKATAISSAVTYTIGIQKNAFASGDLTGKTIKVR